MIASPNPVVYIGVSSCLLGQEVRYDGGHKRHQQLIDHIGPYAQLVPVCPELELGLGVPREKIRLVGNRSLVRLVTESTDRDLTADMLTYAESKLDSLQHLSGYVLKSRSPSCGLTGVKLYDQYGEMARDGTGVFARELLGQFPDMPVVEDHEITDADGCERFMARVVAYHELRTPPK